MNAQGYKEAPLSVEMEQRIRDRIRQIKGMPYAGQPLTHVDMLTTAAHVHGLEWVLREAESIKLERRPESICHHCGHLHRSGEECEVEMGGAGVCGCKAEVPA